ncbi:DUF2510 domain-containing protein [Oerskovia enterophila]|uniref:DUF2510 domain-containing protein n=1 Tax=Oerskovia enterophila TaxID=43678 RepID=UPI00380C4273
MTHQPGWYPDPYDPRLVRWFDGEQWTQHSQPVQPPPSRKLSTGSIVLIVVGAILLLCAIVAMILGVVALVAFFANIAQGVVCGESPHYCT